jgi:hypothetical protein
MLVVVAVHRITVVAVLVVLEVVETDPQHKEEVHRVTDQLIPEAVVAVEDILTQVLVQADQVVRA